LRNSVFLFFLLTASSFSTEVRIGLFSLWRPSKLNLSVETPCALDIKLKTKLLARWLAKPGEPMEVVFSREEKSISFFLRRRLLCQCTLLPGSEIFLETETGQQINWILTVSSTERRYRGRISLLLSEENYLIPVLVIPLEEYVAQLVASELPFQINLKLYKAQAVCCRSYALAMKNKHHYFDFCDTTHCQFFQGLSLEKKRLTEARKAAEESAGLVLSDGRKVLPGYYTGCCSGWTATPSLVWGKTQEGYRQVRCHHPPGNHWEFWQRKLDPDMVRKIFLPGTLSSRQIDLRITKESSPGGYVGEISCFQQKLSGEEFRRRYCQQTSWNNLPGLSFSLYWRKSHWVAEGSGLGHGVGLCQTGALLLAKEGKSFMDILHYYFPDLFICHFKSVVCDQDGFLPLQPLEN